MPKINVPNTPKTDMNPGVAIEPGKPLCGTAAGRHCQILLLPTRGTKFCKDVQAPGGASVPSRASDNPDGENLTTEVCRREEATYPACRFINATIASSSSSEAWHL